MVGFPLLFGMVHDGNLASFAILNLATMRAFHARRKTVKRFSEWDPLEKFRAWIDSRISNHALLLEYDPDVHALRELGDFDAQLAFNIIVDHL